MAKNFPYFKFIVTEWMTGDIVFEDFEVQGLFINICALYWQRDGVLSIDEINKRYKKPARLTDLIDHFIIVNDGLISIDFLDEQLKDANHVSKVNSENGSKGGRKKANGKRTVSESKQIIIKEELNNNENKDITVDFFYIGINLFKQPISDYIKCNLGIWLESWVKKNPTIKLKDVFSAMDKEKVGTQYADENHIRNTFAKIAKNLSNPKQPYNGNQPPQPTQGFSLKSNRNNG